MLAAAMNPCPCGYFNDKSRDCMCTPPMIQRYVSKVSGPLLDRIDIHIEVPAVQYKELRGGQPAEGSAEIRARVLAARERQHARFLEAEARTKRAARAPPAAPSSPTRRCPPSRSAPTASSPATPSACSSAPCSSRASAPAPTTASSRSPAPSPTSIRRTAIAVKHIAEAIQYRTLDRSYWS